MGGLGFFCLFVLTRIINIGNKMYGIVHLPSIQARILPLTVSSFMDNSLIHTICNQHLPSSLYILYSLCSHLSKFYYKQLIFSICINSLKTNCVGSLLLKKKILVILDYFETLGRKTYFSAVCIKYSRYRYIRKGIVAKHLITALGETREC